MLILDKSKTPNNYEGIRRTLPESHATDTYEFRFFNFWRVFSFMEEDLSIIDYDNSGRKSKSIITRQGNEDRLWLRMINTDYKDGRGNLLIR